MDSVRRYHPVMLAERAFLIDDHPIVVDALRALLRTRFAAVDVATSLAEAAIVLATGHRYSLALVDYALGDGCTAGLIAQLHALEVPTVLFTGHVTSTIVRTALDAGASGVVAKGTPSSLLLEAIAAVEAGRRFLCPHSEPLARRRDEAPRLSARELEVLGLIARGMTCKEIAAQLGVAPRTIETHRERLHAKLDAHNAADLTREALRRRLIGPD